MDIFIIEYIMLPTNLSIENANAVTLTNAGTHSFVDMNNVNNVIVGHGSDLNDKKLVRDCTIIGANCFIDTGDNVAIIGNNVKLLNNDIAYTKDAIYLGNTKQKLYLFDNESYIYDRFSKISQRINSIYEELERPDRSLYIPVNNQYIDVNKTLSDFENRIDHLEWMLDYIQKAQKAEKVKRDMKRYKNAHET
jgi:hypothetical protein